MTKPTYEELERENARLQKENAELDLGNGVLLERIADLEAENARLHDRLNTVISDREHFVRLMNEARHWARHLKKRYRAALQDTADLIKAIMSDE